MKKIEIKVSPRGEVTVQTKGYAGAECEEASKSIEKALGVKTSDERTSEYFQEQPLDQNLSQGM